MEEEKREQAMYLIKLRFSLQDSFVSYDIHFQIRPPNIKVRTSQDMDGTFTLIFANSETNLDLVTKISKFLHLREITTLLL